MEGSEDGLVQLAVVHAGVHFALHLSMRVRYVHPFCLRSHRWLTSRAGTKFTLPTITKAMGFNNTNAQLMTVPPYVCGAISAVVFARLSDRFYWRLPFIAIPLAFIAIGYSIIISFNICIGNIGGVIGSYMYLDSEKPKYYTGFGLSLAFGATGFIVSFLLEASYKWGNNKKARMSEEEIREKYTDEDLRAMGDKSPLFKYVL